MDSISTTFVGPTDYVYVRRKVKVGTSRKRMVFTNYISVS